MEDVEQMLQPDIADEPQMQVKRMLGGHALACKKGKKWKK